MPWPIDPQLCAPVSVMHKCSCQTKHATRNVQHKSYNYNCKFNCHHALNSMPIMRHCVCTCVCMCVGVFVFLLVYITISIVLGITDKSIAGIDVNKPLGYFFMRLGKKVDSTPCSLRMRGTVKQMRQKKTK